MFEMHPYLISRALRSSNLKSLSNQFQSLYGRRSSQRGFMDIVVLSKRKILTIVELKAVPLTIEDLTDQLRKYIQSVVEDRPTDFRIAKGILIGPAPSDEENFKEQFLRSCAAFSLQATYKILGRDVPYPHQVQCCPRCDAAYFCAEGDPLLREERWRCTNECYVMTDGQLRPFRL